MSVFSIALYPPRYFLRTDNQYASLPTYLYFSGVDFSGLKCFCYSRSWKLNVFLVRSCLCVVSIAHTLSLCLSRSPITLAGMSFFIYSYCFLHLATLVLIAMTRHHGHRICGLLHYTATNSGFKWEASKWRSGDSWDEDGWFALLPKTFVLKVIYNVYRIMLMKYQIILFNLEFNLI